MRGPRLLGVFAHPDDESYAAGGLIAWCAGRGAAVEIVCATRGEAGGVRDATMLGDGDLGSLRSAELARSCRALGARPPTFLGWPDGAVAAVNERQRSDALGVVLDRFEPQVVVTLGHDGAYGHADHVAVTQTALASVALRPDAAIRVLLCQFPRGLFAPVLRVMRRLGVALADGARPDSLGMARTDVDWCLPLSGEVRAAKRASVAAHRSQLPTDDPRSFLRPGLLDPLLEEEWYTVASGAPIPAGSPDPFAGL